ncbi:MAG: indole-3-glycerol phosphate synthase TrpC [Balneolales bacterium]
MSTILDNIVTRTLEDVTHRRKKHAASDFESFGEYHRPRRDFYNSLRQTKNVSVIAELKKASPSKGVIRQDFNPIPIADSYQKNGASAISVLTDEPFFQGHIAHLLEVSTRVDIPVLRKDFIVDFYQIEEARAWGADAILLIVKITDGEQLYELHDAAVQCGLQTLVECYDMADWDRLDFNRFSAVGVNNRNLETFEVDVHRGIQMLEQAPDGVIRVSESGLHHPGDLLLLSNHGIHAALIGEHFMCSDNPGKELEKFTSVFTTE